MFVRLFLVGFLASSLFCWQGLVVAVVIATLLPREVLILFHPQIDYK